MNPKFRDIALEAGGSTYPEVNSVQLEKFANLLIESSVNMLISKGMQLEAELLQTHWNEPTN